jgi:predicted O-methyltransferase YrrM
MRPRNWRQKSTSALYHTIDQNRTTYAKHLEDFLHYKEVFQKIKLQKDQTNENEPAWNNGFFPGLDIVVLYGMIQKYKPKKFIEIGSGNSTKVVRTAIIDGKLDTQITSIDPFPRASIDHLADIVIRKPIEALEDLSFAKELNENDILFIDNSHRSFPNSDVTVCFLELIPLLKKGVIVHVHDIYLPYDYPQFMCDRAYNEQYMLAPFILANPQKYFTLCPNFFISEDEELSKIIQPVWKHPTLEQVEHHGGSFWFQIRD